MKIAVDLDGTITAVPFFFEVLMRACQRGQMTEGITLIILTACFNGQPTREEKEALLRHHNLFEGTHYDELVIVEGVDLHERGTRKAVYCRDHQVDAIFEDCDIYIDLIRKISPKTACWRLHLI
jgi:hypothetical protein